MTPTINSEPKASWMSPRVIFGLLVVAFGLAMLLDNLDVLNALDLLRFWPVGLLLVGVAYMVQADGRSERIFGGILTAVGVVFVLEIFFGIEVHIWRWWPLAVVAFGALVVAKAFLPEEPASKVQVGVVFGGSSQPGVGSAARAGSQDPTYTELAIFSGIERRVASPAFKRADLTAIMGGIEFDLRQATTDHGEAVIDVFVTWGGIEITVPPDWAVSNKITAIMGGVEDQSAGTQMSQNRLIIKGVVLMGGVTIKT